MEPAHGILTVCQSEFRPNKCGFNLETFYCLLNGVTRSHLISLPMASTFNTYPELITDRGRHARTDWPRASAAEAVAATLRHDPAAIVSSVIGSDCSQPVRGLMPGGIA